MNERKYIAIDLKSFYASVECVERGLDPMDTNLVVADISRTEKTICLAVTPSLKAYGISGRARLFEVVQKANEINSCRLYTLGRKKRGAAPEFSGSSYSDSRLKADPSLKLDYIIAPPRMAYYMKYSARIYEIYLKYVAPEDIFPYSVDEVFIDASAYLNTYGMTARGLASAMIKDVLCTTGITAAAGTGTNLYLCKVAMDIMAKHVPPDENGVRIAELDEQSYRKELWEHRPLTDFWRVGRGTAKRLEEYGIFTMGDIARCSLSENGYQSESTLYRLFGKNTELLIDHAWGYEPCTLPAIKAYKPETKSISSGQVLSSPHDYEHTLLLIREMADQLSLDLAGKGLVTDRIVITIGYDAENVRNGYKGEVSADRYGRLIPKHSRGTADLGKYTSSSRLIISAAAELAGRIADRELLSRRLNITACRVLPASEAEKEEDAAQLCFFSDPAVQEHERAEEKREKNMQMAILKMKKRYGKNAVLRGMNFREGATARERNGQIGGHKA